METQIEDADQALEDVLKDKESWDFDVAFGRLQIKMQLAQMKYEIQQFPESMIVLKDAEVYADDMREDVSKRDVSYHNQKNLLL